MAQSEKYFYCVAKTDEERIIEAIGLGDERSQVYTIAHRGVAAVVSDSPFCNFAALPKKSLLHSLAVHQFVMEQLMREYSVIPVKFGTVVKGEEGVREIIEIGYPEIRQALETVEGKIELDVVAQWKDLTSALKEIGRQKEIQEFKKAAAQRTPAQCMEARIRLGQMVKAALERKREIYALEIVEALTKEATDVCINDPLDETMVVNVAFLLDRDREVDIDETLRSLDERYRKAVNFRCVGPLPPYSFGTLEVNEVGAERIDAALKELGLGRKAGLKEIKEAYRRLTKQYHPDRYSEAANAASKFQKVSKAYRVLTEFAGDSDYPFHRENHQSCFSVRVLRLSEMGSRGELNPARPLTCG